MGLGDERVLRRGMWYLHTHIYIYIPTYLFVPKSH